MSLDSELQLIEEKTRGNVYSTDCPCRDLLDVVANKWSALAIGALADGPVRFGVLQRRLQGVSPKVLTATLRRLERFGLVNREVIPAVPLHVEYSLTDAGRSALGPVFALRDWAENNYAHARALADRHEDGPSEAAC
ncbi:helix-turn-helix domain-containing protein [Microbacterium sp. STN6]|uniref:winged helix-turn-helix transcriptional regulator n=1 Tax=Microbacterium sp. STN6 TaxID=2995588 RepID=UPI00226094BA|nr:helix-turn-helix domain-containing protein [Microbacterium sp. STN6]MCX7523465.1 helix-turn-helix domain-containing protein [Microbacterium sp. STN6]